MQVYLSLKPMICKSSLIFIPLLLSAFTHLWNPIGFPFFEQDEGIYMLRSMYISEGQGSQLPKNTYFYTFDHPYFGQLFLASALSLINYPDFLDPTIGDVHSIEMLYLVPRVLMGVLAVIDTFLVFKIAETRFNRKVAFISSSLFAVMPMSWMLRGIYLDSIQLPFLLSSILFALYYVKRSERDFNDSRNNERNRDRKIILLLLSGIFLGLAIFTKLPAFTMIPLIVFILLENRVISRRIVHNYGYDNSTVQRDKDRSLKARIISLKLLGIWFVPVILIPIIWPAYAMSTGQSHEWLDGLLYQATRDPNRTLRSSIILIFEMNPIFIGFAAAGLIYAIVKKDYFILLWIFPYVIFLYAIGWVTHFHWIPVFPLLCIALGRLLEDLKKIWTRKLGYILIYSTVSAILISGFYFTVAMITSNLNSQYLRLSSFINQALAQSSEDDHENKGETIAMIGSHRTRALMWIPLYVFKSDVIFKDTDITLEGVRNVNFTNPIQTKKFILVADSNLLARLNDENQLKDWIGDRRVAKLYYNGSETVASFLDNENDKYDFMSISENHGLGRFIEVRANY
jgi:4-amino-4-deoxy-L-arabinose transferase-like glycosyltransferase